MYFFEIIRSMKRFVFFEFIYLFISFLHLCMFPACSFCQRTYMAQGLINGVLNETWTHLCLQFEWFSVGYWFIWRFSSLFLRVCLPLLYPSLIFDLFLSLFICVCVCVCVCIGAVLDFTNSYFSTMCVCVCVCVGDFFACVCGVMWFEIYFLFCWEEEDVTFHPFLFSVFIINNVA